MLFNKVFRFISIILLFTNVSGWREPPPHTFGKQYRGSQHSGSHHRGSQHRGSQHSDSLKPQPFKHINLSRLRNIDLQKISSHFNSSVPAATLGLAMASWSINTILFHTVRTITYVFDSKKKVNVEAKPIENKTEPAPKNNNPITEEEVLKCQEDWSNAIEIISAAYLDGGDFVDAAIKTAGDLYGYEHHEVLFKPTKATNHPFRATGEEAMSYFVGAENSINADKFKGEDAGFAINGGKGWKKVVFDNHKITFDGTTALAMGSYYFTCATTGEVTIADFTFGYKRCIDGKPRIFLHHSSVPYRANQPQTETKEPVLSTQPPQVATHIHIHTTTNDMDASNHTFEKNGENHLQYLVK